MEANDLIQKRLLGEIYNILGGKEQKSINDLITERCAELSISIRQLSQILNIARPSLQRILDGEAQKLDILTLKKVANFLGQDLQSLLLHFDASLTKEEKAEVDFATRATYIVSNFDLEGLKRCGFIKSVTDFDEIETRITSFLGIKSIYEYSTEVCGTLFSRTKVNSNDRMREFWVKSAVLQFEKIANPNEYDRSKLMELIPKIRPYCQDIEKGFITVVRALYNAGVTVIAQNYLNKTSVRGGTFIINNKPCIVITNYRGSYGTIWFTLFHELYHVIYDADQIASTRYHLSGENDLLLSEKPADNFAQLMLFSEDKLNYVTPFINTPGFVSGYAKKAGVHPSVIYEAFLYRQSDDKYYAFYNKYISKSENSLSLINKLKWTDQSQTIEQVAEETKPIFV